MKKVYIVTSGVYSNYSILSVHTDKDAAMQAAARKNGSNVGLYSDARVETWTLDETAEAEQVTRFTYREALFGKRNLIVVPTMAAPCPPRTQYGFNDRYCGVVEAKSFQAAKKIAAEQIAMVRAQEAGIT